MLRITTCALALLLFVSTSNATIITYEMTVEFSGATPPEGATPWMTMTIDDQNTPGSVILSLDTTNIVDNEFVFGWYVNLDDSLDPTDLLFSAPVKTGAFADPTVNLGTNAFMADGDGRFDILVEFSNMDGPPTRFGVGDAVSYTVTGIAGLDAMDFAFDSQMGGGNGTFFTAAHVGGIGPTDSDSGWIGTPEPATIGLLGFGALALVRRRR